MQLVAELLPTVDHPALEVLEDLLAGGWSPSSSMNTSSLS
jgi:hypothetical protein